jgi:hypothetical protein
LPADAAERHLDALAKAVKGGGDTLPSHLKPGYMRAALTVVGERPEADEIRQLVQYYDGLLRELEVTVRVDGDTTVGHGDAFGVFFTVRHTAELERRMPEVLASICATNRSCSITTTRTGSPRSIIAMIWKSRCGRNSPKDSRSSASPFTTKKCSRVDTAAPDGEKPTRLPALKSERRFGGSHSGAAARS